MRDKILFTILISFLLGVFIRSFLFIPVEIIYLGFGLGVVLIFCGLFFKKRTLIILGVFVPVFVLGVFRFHYTDIHQPKNVFDDYLGEEVVFKGFVSEEPDRRENSQRLVVKDSKIKILVTTELYPEFNYGDYLLVKGEISKPKNFITDIGKEFNYIDYLAKDKIFYNISFAEVSFLESGYGSPVRGFLFRVKKKFLNNIERSIPDPESSLLGGLLLGTKQSLGDDLEQRFIDTGLIHIVVLSGYNVTIIADSIMRSLSFLPFFLGISLGVFSIILFALMTGAGATIVRASIMAILALLARASGNGYSITRALLLAGFLMVLHNPYILYFDLSFQLSFLATVGLIYLSPVFERYFLWLPKAFGLREITGATIATQIFVLPFILYKIGTLSIIAPISNLLVLPLIPHTMFFGFISGLLGLVSMQISIPFAFVAHKLLSLEIWFVNIFSSFSFSAISVRRFSLLLVVVIYLFIFFIIYKNNKISINETKR